MALRGSCHIVGRNCPTLTCNIEAGFFAPIRVNIASIMQCISIACMTLSHHMLMFEQPSWQSAVLIMIALHID